MPTRYTNVAAPAPPLTAPPPHMLPVAPPQELCTFGSAWRARMNTLQEAAKGNIAGYIKHKEYVQRKRTMATARKAWVEEWGMKKAVPPSMWPKMPDGTDRLWVPAESWLTAAQMADNWDDKYLEQWELIVMRNQQRSSASSS